MNSSRPTSNSTISNEPRRQSAECDDDFIEDKTENDFDDMCEEEMQKNKEPTLVPRDLEKRYTTQPLDYDEGIKSESRWTFLKK